MVPGYPKLNNLLQRYRSSVLIDQKNFAIITNWIKRNGKKPTDRYNFRSIYRVSRDGNTAEVFHFIGANIVIAKLDINIIP